MPQESCIHTCHLRPNSTSIHVKCSISPYSTNQSYIDFTEALGPIPSPTAHVAWTFLWSPVQTPFLQVPLMNLRGTEKFQLCLKITQPENKESRHLVNVVPLSLSLNSLNEILAHYFVSCIFNSIHIR